MKRMIPALLLMLLLLTGCGGAASNSASADRAPMENGSFDTGGDFNYGWAEDSMSSAETPGMPEIAPETDGSSGLPAGVKMIYTADVTLQTKEYDAACAALNSLVTELGGYFETRELNQGGAYRSMYCVVRVPAGKFIPFLDRAGNIANMTYRSENSTDVSEAYYDLEARLTTQRTKLTRLQELLAKAESMEDIITIESSISDTELQIEYLTGSLRHYDSLIGFSTINLSLNEVYRLSTEEETPVTFGDRLSSAFKRGLEQGVENIEDFIIYIARNWLTLIVWAVIIVLVVFFVRRRRRNRKEELRGSVPAFLKKNGDKSSDNTEEK